MRIPPSWWCVSKGGSRTAPTTHGPLIPSRETTLTIVELALSAGSIGGQVSTEYLQFAGAIVLMVGILIVSYWFVYVPDRRDSDDREKDPQ